MRLKQAIGFLALAAIVAAVWFYFENKQGAQAQINSFEECAAAGYPIMESYPEQCRTPDGRTFTRKISNDYSDLITVTAPTVNAQVGSPLTVTGQARGQWYFEASFPVTLVDANGTTLAQVPAQAQGEWMTENFVPFKATLTFAPPATQTGTLILHNDNPSGLPENDKEIRIPVRFSSAPAPTSAVFDKEVSVSIGKSITFTDGLVMTLTEINDSRCKPDVQCIWQGELAPVFSVSGGAFFKSLRQIQLGTVNNQSVTQNGYTFTLKSATEASATIVVTK